MDWNGWIISDNHYIYYYGQESLGRNGVAIMVNKRVRNAVLGCNLKNNRMISVPFFPRQTIQYHSNPSLCPNQERWRSWSWMVLWRPPKPSSQFSRSVVSNSLRPHESQHARPPCPSPTPGVHPDSTSIKSVMPSSHLILWRPFLLLPPIPPSIRVFSNESTLRVKNWLDNYKRLRYLVIKHEIKI